MKRFIKNVLLTFVIIYTILNLVLFVINNISRNYLLHEEVVPLLQEIDIEKSIEIEEGIKSGIERYKFEENTPATALYMYYMYFSGMNQVLYGQGTILIATVVLSIAIGTIIYLKEESKMREVLYFITIGIVYILVCAGYLYLWGEFGEVNIFEALIETIDRFGFWYVVGYVLVYMIRIYKYKKKVKELNKELENKNK